MTKKIKKPKRQLADLSQDELLTHARELRRERADLRVQLSTSETRVAELELSERTLRANNIELQTTLESREQELEQLRQELETASINNTKLQGIIESGGDDVLINNSVGERIIERLDTLIVLAGGDPPEDTSAEDEDVDDTSDHDAAESDFRVFDNDDESEEDEEEDEEIDLEIPPTPEGAEAVIEPSANEPVPIHGANVDITSPVTSDQPPQVEDTKEHQVGVTEDTLSDLVVPQIKATVDAFEGYEDLILAPVRAGDITKDFALRQVVAKTYPEHPEMAETILESQTTRDKVYEAMGV